MKHIAPKDLKAPRPLNRPLMHKSALTLANELERRHIRKHCTVNEIMEHAGPGESFSSMCTRIGRTSAAYKRWVYACDKEQEALLECRARYGDAVRFVSAWPAYVAKRARMCEVVS